MGRIFRPNILIMGFKTDWQSLSARKIDEYVGIVRDAFENAYGVGILRNSGCERLGFDMFTSQGQTEVNIQVIYSIIPFAL